MCYMKPDPDATGDVSVRELRQNLSKYVRRVLQGERLRVMSRGRPVAILGPLPAGSGPIARLVAEGRLLTARGTIDALGEPPKAPTETTISEALDEQRSR